MQLPIDVVRAIDAQATKWNVPVAHLAAVVEVESNGQVFGPDGRPVLLFEPHLFARKLSGASLEEALRTTFQFGKVSLHIASKAWNPKLYAGSQAGRWAQVEHAQQHQIHHGDSDIAAFESASYGVGQVLGEWWDELDFASFQDFWETIKTVEGQIEVMMRYIRVNGLLDELQEGRWTAFARGYNGPAYAKSGYHRKLAAAAERQGGAVAETDGMLRLGAKGKRVRELQALLVRAGQQVKVDGDFGPSTKKALKAFQSVHGITVDGIAGPQTQKALAKYRQGAGDKPGDQKITEVKEVVEGAGGIGGGFVVESLQNKVDEATTTLQSVDGFQPWIGYGLAALSIIAVGLAAWGVYRAVSGYLSSRKTMEA